SRGGRPADARPGRLHRGRARQGSSRPRAADDRSVGWARGGDHAEDRHALLARLRDRARAGRLAAASDRCGGLITVQFFDPLSIEFWIPIGMSMLCGGMIGLERQLRGKPAGIRTSILICLSTTIFIHLGLQAMGEATDTSRVLGQVVTGVGFLGAGVIISREGTLTGVTTASVVW